MCIRRSGSVVNLLPKWISLVDFLVLIELPGPWTVKEEVFTCREDESYSNSAVVIGLCSKLGKILNLEWYKVIFLQKIYITNAVVTVSLKRFL